MSTVNALVAAARDGDVRQIKTLAKQCMLNRLTYHVILIIAGQVDVLLLSLIGSLQMFLLLILHL